VKQRREQWQQDQPILPTPRLIFLDESGAKTNMTRLRGRAKKGTRVYDSAPCGRWETTTLISSIRLDGQTACLAIEGATTSEIFREYVRQILAPTLRKGDIVILDNLSSHKDSKALALIRAKGAREQFLPPYSPDFNPIEKMWSKVKEHLRGAKARTQETLYQSITSAFKTITAHDAENWFKSCGYIIN
jgi:transposase